MHTLISSEGRKHTLFIERDKKRSEVLQNIIRGLFSVSNRGMRWNIYKAKREAQLAQLEIYSEMIDQLDEKLKEYEQK